MIAPVLSVRPFRRGYAMCVSGALVLSLTAGCATTSIPTLGIRPNQPGLEYSDTVKARCKDEAPPENADAYRECLYFYNIVDWGQDLSEAYRTRATLNEWGLMAAGIVALAVVGSVTGLAAFNQAGSDAAKIIPLAGGFVAGAAALWDNKARAAAYTHAARIIDEALSDARKGLTATNYRQKAETLQEKITEAKNELEEKRSEFGTLEERLNKAEQEIKALQERPPAP
jgi:hypothetical protein